MDVVLTMLLALILVAYNSMGIKLIKSLESKENKKMMFFQAEGTKSAGVTQMIIIIVAPHHA